ncbi:hypothetical protein LCGC14_1058470 [marine sediment metagenome]|uniref:Uncharacterized protein n=1 Tax=marine sediment metagenome TaxID=412755 RepID=A0A0F9Q4T1_9ZZZZ
MTETATNAPICKTQICKRPLTYLEDSKCWRCLICNPIPKTVPKVLPKKPALLDNKVTEERVEQMIKEVSGISEDKIREIVQDELMNWHVPKPSVTAGEVDTLTKPETYMQKAKRLGVATHYKANGTMAGGMRKKADVLADIEKEENVQEELRTEEQAGGGGGERPSVDTGSSEMAR